MTASPILTRKSDAMKSEKEGCFSIAIVAALMVSFLRGTGF